MKQSQQPSSLVQTDTTNKFFLIASLIIVFATTVIYFKSLNNEFVTHWDDNAYVVNNDSLLSSVNKSTSENLHQIFTSYVAGNYHPLTMLSYYVEYSSFQLNPKPYHVVNLIIHILNSLLVMGFVWLLFRQKWAAVITALLFAIHPMHVESVAWISERKDVLYTLFYLASLCTYLLYLNNSSKKWFYYTLTLILFICGTLSKAMAVTVPIILFAIDFYKGRSIGIKTVLEKAPFLIISLIIGYVATLAQASANAYHEFDYDFIDRILFSCYGICMYIGKLFVPTNLQIFYHYPIRDSGYYPILFYLSPLLIGLTLFTVYKLKSFKNEILFGIAFYLITIALVLQLFPVGGSLAFERYTYIPYIGIFLIIGLAFNRLIESNSLKVQNYKMPVKVILILFCLTMAYTSHQRTKVWENNITLFTDFIEKNDGRIAETFESRGLAYADINQHKRAIADFSKALSLRAKLPNVLFSRGMSYGNIGMSNEAVADFTLALKYDSTITDAYFNRANSYYNLKEYKKSIIDFNEAIRLNSESEQIYYNRGLAYQSLEMLDAAINDFKKAVSLKPNFSEVHRTMGLLYYNHGHYQLAVQAYDKALQYDSSTVYIYFNRAIAHYELKNYSLALENALKAKSLGYNTNPNFIKDVKAKLSN